MAYGLGRGSDGRFVHHARRLALPSEWAVRRLAAVTLSLVSLGRWGEDLGVVAADYGSHVACAAVTALHVVPVEESMVSMVAWEVLVHKLPEPFSYISCYVWLYGGLNHIMLR